MTNQNSRPALHDLVSREASLPSRIRYTGLLLAGAGIAALISLLWATEPSLPLRTQVAFGAIVAIGLAWAVFASWQLSTRRALYATDRVIAGWMAVGASTLFTILAVVMAASRSTSAQLAVALVGVASIAGAFLALHLARGRRRELQRRLAEIETEA